MAKGDRDKKLTQRQELAVRELAKGKGLTAAARAVGVSRRTIHNWLDQPGFIAAMNRWRELVFTIARGQIIAGLGDAAATVVKAAREGNARVALALLEKNGIFDPPSHPGIDPDQIAREQLLRQRADRVALDNTERALADTEKLNDLRRALDAPPSMRSPKAPATPAEAGGNEGPGGTEPEKGSYEQLLKVLGLPPGFAKEIADRPTRAATYKPDPEVEAAVAAADAFIAAEAAKAADRRAAEAQTEQALSSRDPGPGPRAPSPTGNPQDGPAAPNPSHYAPTDSATAPPTPTTPRRKPPPPPVAWSSDEYP